MDSKRLKGKNLRKIHGKTLVEYAVEYALDSNYVKEIIISTESDEVRAVGSLYNGDLKSQVIICPRPKHLLKEADTVDVFVDVFQNQLRKQGEERVVQAATHVIGLQPDNPDRTTELDDVVNYFVDGNYDDLITVDAHGKRNGAVRIIKAEYVISAKVSRKVGSFLDDCTNIHTEEDLAAASDQLRITY